MLRCYAKDSLNLAMSSFPASTSIIAPMYKYLTAWSWCPVGKSNTANLRWNLSIWDILRPAHLDHPAHPTGWDQKFPTLFVLPSLWVFKGLQLNLRFEVHPSSINQRVSSKQTTSLSAGHSSSQSIFTRVAWPFRKVLKLWRSLGIGWLELLVNGLNTVVTTWKDNYLQYFSNHPKWCRMFFSPSTNFIENSKIPQRFQFIKFQISPNENRLVEMWQHSLTSNHTTFGTLVDFKCHHVSKKKEGGYEGGVIPLHHGNSKRKSSMGFGSIGRCELTSCPLMEKGMRDLLNHLQTGCTNLPEGYRSSTQKGIFAETLQPSWHVHPWFFTDNHEGQCSNVFLITSPLSIRIQIQSLA